MQVDSRLARGVRMMLDPSKNEAPQTFLNTLGRSSEQPSPKEAARGQASPEWPQNPLATER